MESNRGAGIAWTAGVCGGAATLAAVFATFTGPGWRIAVFVLAAVAALFLLFLIVAGFRPTSLWLKEARRQRRLRKEPPRRVITDRWRYTSAAFDVGTLANLAQKGFSHDLYLRLTEKKPPAVRFGVFVACGLLPDDEPTAEQLRSGMRNCLSQPEFMGLIGKLTGIDAAAEWHSRPGRGRFNLEADLLGPPGSGRVFASALLLLPERGIMRYGKDGAGAELYLHVDLPTEDGVPVGAGLAEWHGRFIAALALPGLLSRFLEDVGLMTSGDPAARFAIQLQARSLATIGLNEIVDFGDLAVLSPRKYSVRFDGWAVADEQGKATGAVSKRFLTELCESTGRTGCEGIVADLTDAGDQRVGFPPNDSRRVVQVRRHRVGLIGATSILVVAAVVVVFTLIHDAGRASAKVPPRPTLRISPHLVRTLNGRVATVDVAYSPNGETLVTANSYGGINLWDVAAGHRVIAPLLEPYYDGANQGEVSVAYSPNGQTWAVSGANNVVSVWNVATKRITVPLDVPNCPSGPVNFAYGPDGTTLVTACNSSAEEWDVATGEMISDFPAPPNQNVYAVAYNPKGMTLVTADNSNNSSSSDATGNASGKTYLWDVASGQIVATLTDPRSHGANDVAYSPNGKTVATADSNGDIYLWDATSGREIATLTTKCPGISFVTYSPDSTMLATVCGLGGNNVDLWDVSTRHVVATFTDPDTQGVGAIAYSPNGTSLAVGDNNGNIYVWTYVSRVTHS